MLFFKNTNYDIITRGEIMVVLEVTFDINLSSLFALLIGIGCGVILTVLIGTLITLLNIKKETILIDNIDDEVAVEDINKDINRVKEAFKLKLKEDKEVNFNYIININLQLIRQIASRYYPKAKEPLAELTFEELSLLCSYILNKIDKLMDTGPLHIVKKVKLSWVLQAVNTKSKIDNSKVVKTAKKYKVGKIGKAITTTLQFLNPAMWFRKLIYDPCVNLITKRIVLVIIETVGQETYHIYSKQAFLEPIEEKELQQFINNLDKLDAIDIEE